MFLCVHASTRNPGGAWRPPKIALGSMAAPGGPKSCVSGSRADSEASESCCGKHGSAERPEDMRVRKPGGTRRPSKAAVGSLAKPGGPGRRRKKPGLLGGIRNLLITPGGSKETCEEPRTFPVASETCFGKPGNTRKLEKLHQEAIP